MNRKSITKHIPPPPGPGRPKGSKGKATIFLNDMIEIYEEKGGKGWLGKWIDSSNYNLREFMKTILIIAAKQVTEKHDINLPSRFEIVFNGNGNGAKPTDGADKHPT